MITQMKFECFIEALRLYKAHITNSYGYIGDESLEFSYIQEIYDQLVDSFIDATMDEQLCNQLETFSDIIDNDDDDDEISPYNLLNTYVDYGYAYIIQTEETYSEEDKELQINISDNGILLNNDKDFYNYFVKNEYPENPIYKNITFNSIDRENIAKKYIKYIRNRTFEDNFCII